MLLRLLSGVVGGVLSTSSRPRPQPAARSPTGSAGAGASPASAAVGPDALLGRLAPSPRRSSENKYCLEAVKFQGRSLG